MHLIVDVRRITCAPDRKNKRKEKPQVSALSLGGEGGGLPRMANHREAPFENGTFFKPQVYERVGVSLIEGYEGVGKYVIWLSFMALSSRENVFFL